MNSLISIQILRAVAAWLVVYHHEHALLSIQHFNHNFQSGYLGVDIFFIISGFIMFHSLESRGLGAKEFFIKRLVRIVPAYWVFTLLMVLVSWVYTEEFSYTDWNGNTLLASLFFYSTSNPSGIGYFPLLTVGWTLSFEMFFYACLGVCIFAFGKFRFLVCAAILLVLPLAWDDYWIYGWSTKLLYEFVIGIVIGYSYSRFKQVNTKWLYVLGTAAFLSIILLTQLDINDAEGGMLGFKRSVSAFLLVVAALSFESVLAEIKLNAFSWLKYLGDISYSTYLVHPLVIGVLLHYVGVPGSMLGEVISLAVISLAIIVASHFGYQYIEVGSFARALKRRCLK